MNTTFVRATTFAGLFTLSAFHAHAMQSIWFMIFG
jgi:hypothetical protein